MLYEFCKITSQSLEDNDGKFLWQIFDQIQEQLSERGKQIMVMCYNNGTRYVRFKKNNNENKEEVKEIELMNEIIEKHLDQHQVENEKIMDEFEDVVHSDHDIHVPLCKFNNIHIHDILEQWIFNDIHYKTLMERTKDVFTTHILSGQVISAQPLETTNFIMQNKLNQFMTPETIKIMFEYLQKRVKTDIETIKTETAKQIAQDIYEFPINILLREIKENKEKGTNIINLITNETIKSVTGWNNDEIYQLESLLKQHKTFTKQELLQNMNRILSDTSLPNTTVNEIKTAINQFDAEQLHFDIKNGRNIDAFSDVVRNIVDDLVSANEDSKRYNNGDAYVEDNFVKKIYEKIAQCFVWKDKNLNSLVRNDDW
eukprot:219505_1